MNILVTGANGFVGKNLVLELKNQGYMNILEYDVDTDPALLNEFCAKADFVFNLAGVNRPVHETDFMEGNFGFAWTLLEILKKNKNSCPVMISSSMQAALDNPYGRSKKAGEELMFSYAGETGAKVFVYRFQNVFGKWCRPNYNSVVATFCYNIARGLPIQINDADAVMNLVYIDDVVEELIRSLQGAANQDGKYCSVPVSYSIGLGDMAARLYSFEASRDEKSIPDMSNAFTSKLYSTYVSYLPEDKFNYGLKMNTDSRGSYTEFIRTADRGQVSINVSKPGITKGNHWHHSKNEKFLVVSGTGVIRFRKIGSCEIEEYAVSGDKLEVVDIPCGYTHHIENIGDTDMVTVMWANECFNPDKPDTYFMEV